MPELIDFMRAEAMPETPAGVREFAEHLSRSHGAAAVLFYGSILRTGDTSGVLDYYLLTKAPHRRGFRGWVEARLWPEVSFQTLEVEGRVLHAKVATMPLAVFARAARGEAVDTTIWARFVQPSALVWAADDQARAEVFQALAAAVVTAGRFAALHGPASAPAADYWAALFRQTYAAELRVEPPGRERQILAFHPGRYEALLPLAWQAGAVAFETDGDVLAPRLKDEEAGRLTRAWRLRRRLGKALNAARLAKAAFTFEGAARYAAWKIERHTGIAVPLTPWRERHPILAAPGVLWSLRRARRAQAEAR